MVRLRIKTLGASVSFLLLTIAASALGGEHEPGWQLADRSGKGDAALALYVEAMPTPGRPAFRLETTFDAAPSFVHRILVDSMLAPDTAPRGQRRKVLERTENGAIVYTYVDLPMMLSDREVALRVVESTDPSTGIHRVEWAEANELLPPVGPDVVRLTGAKGFWEFRPDGRGRTRAIHMTQTEIGGSFPAALGDRLMRSQAVESVESLRERIARYAPGEVAAGPP